MLSFVECLRRSMILTLHVPFSTLQSNFNAVLLSPTYQKDRYIMEDPALTTCAISSITDVYTYVQCRYVLATRSFARNIILPSLKSELAVHISATPMPSPSVLAKDKKEVDLSCCHTPAWPTFTHALHSMPVPKWLLHWIVTVCCIFLSKLCPKYSFGILCICQRVEHICMEQGKRLYIYSRVLMDEFSKNHKYITKYSCMMLHN